MGFKEQLKEDLEIFLDLEEFGEKFKVDGVEYFGVIEQPDNKTPKEEYEGVIKDLDFIIYTKHQKDLEKYSAGKEFSLNGRKLIVNRNYIEEGLMVIELYERGTY